MPSKEHVSNIFTLELKCILWCFLDASKIDHELKLCLCFLYPFCDIVRELQLRLLSIRLSSLRPIRYTFCMFFIHLVRGGKLY